MVTILLFLDYPDDGHNAVLRNVD